jgi:hypothetical protein
MKVEKNKKVSRWIVIGTEVPSPKTREKLGLPDDWLYHISLNLKTGKLKCDCYGFMRHKKCHHVEKWLEKIKQKTENVLQKKGTNNQ